MDSLPATALKVLAHHLESCDSYSCRLSCHDLSSVVSASRDDVSHIRVVANSFQQQIQQEMRQQHQQQQQQQQQQGKDVQPSNLNKGPLPGGADDTRGPTTREAAGDTRGPRPLSPSFTPTRSRTAASLAGAVAAFGHKQARVYVDVLQQYEEETWQQLFGVLLSSHSLSTLVIIEYSSSSSVGQDIKRSLELRRMQADMATLTLEPPAAAEEHNARPLLGHWLPSLAAAYTTAAAAAASNSSPALQHLDLQLPAPLPVALQPLLLQLTGLKTLKLSPTRVWPQSPPGCTYLDPSEPLLLPGVVAGLSALSGLESLTCSLSASQTSGIDAQVATKLQQLFSNDVMSHLTHLSLGTSPRSSQLLLSSPLVSLHSLKSLTCQPGFYVDVDNARECMQQQANADTAAAAAAGSSAAVSDNATYQIAPSLTKLVLKEGYSDDHEQLLQLLVGKGLPAAAAAAAAAAARTRLVHLELNSQVTAEVSTDLLSELSGLRYLKMFLGEAVRSAAATPLATQLLGLTILCQYQRLAEDFGVPFQPMPTVTGFANLTSLVIKGPRAVSISLLRDLQQLRALPRLQQFEFHGQLHDSDSPVRQFCDIPGGIHTFVLNISPDYDYELDPTVRVSLRGFPASLTSVKFEGCNLALDDDKDDEGITTPSRLPNLKEFRAQMTNLDDAHRLLRHCSGLHKLSLQGEIPLTPDSSSSSSSGLDCKARIPLQLSLLCPQPTSLHLKLCRQTTGGPGSSSSSSSNSNSSSSRPPPADVVSSWLLPEIAQLRSLRELSLQISSWLPLHRTLLHNLSSLSALSRLQHLTLHAWIHLEEPLQQQQQQQQQRQHGLQTADINSTPTAAAAGEEASQKPATDPALRLTRGDLKEDLLYVSDGPEFPTWWNTAVTDTRNFLYNTLAGSFPGLRYLNLHIYIEHDVDGIEAGTNLPMSSSYRQKVVSSRQDLFEIENSLMNCLVLQGQQNV